LAQRGSRKKRKQRQRSRSEVEVAPVGHEVQPNQPAPAGDAKSTMARGYSRSRQRDDAARAKLKPLRPGERPTAVTVGAIVALLLAVAELVAAAIGYEPGESSKLGRTAVVVPLLLVVAFGMWKAKYWAVLGMQTLLALTIVFASVGAFTALNLQALVLVTAIIVPATVLFWFLVKAMARIQMPTRPGSQAR
jgi:hypothetical protein